MIIRRKSVKPFLRIRTSLRMWSTSWGFMSFCAGFVLFSLGHSNCESCAYQPHVSLVFLPVGNHLAYFTQLLKYSFCLFSSLITLLRTFSLSSTGLSHSANASIWEYVLKHCHSNYGPSVPSCELLGTGPPWNWI